MEYTDGTHIQIIQAVYLDLRDSNSTVQITYCLFSTVLQLKLDLTIKIWSNSADFLMF